MLKNKRHNTENNVYLCQFLPLLLFCFLATNSLAGELTGDWKISVIYPGGATSEIDQLTFDENNEYQTVEGETSIVCIPNVGGELERNGQKIKLAYTFKCSNDSFHSPWRLYLTKQFNKPDEQQQFYMYTSRNSFLRRICSQC